MPTRQDFQAYHESIAGELRVAKDRIRNLIGDRHWLSDGEHKEAVLRKLLRNHVAEALQIGRGFVCGDGNASNQLDILITSRSKPTLFRDGELLLVTPDAVAAIIEVKTRLRNDWSEVLSKLADNVAMVRTNGNPGCVAGLFVYEGQDDDRDHQSLLQVVQSVSQGDKNRVINWIAAGPHQFLRFWDQGVYVAGPVPGAAWHSYWLPELAHAYFLSNVVWEKCPNADPAMQYAWFPAEGGKEQHRRAYIAINNTEPQTIDY